MVNNCASGKMKSQANKLKQEAIRTVRSAGLDWSRIYRNATQIIVFGSRAASAATKTSDLDLLCIGHGRRHKSKWLHIIWIPKCQLRSEEWLGSELATHVAACGKWIKGERDWALNTSPSPEAASRKLQRVRARALAIRDYWDNLLPDYRTRQLTKLRRDLQRFLLMRAGKPPVAAPLLDRAWSRLGGDAAWSALVTNVPSLSKTIKPLLRLATTTTSKTLPGARRLKRLSS